MNEPFILKSHFLKEFKNLAFDKCVNVRICFSNILRKHFKKTG